MPTRQLRAVALAALLGCAPALAPTASEARPIRLVVLGDSLSSGLYIGEGQAVPAVLEASLRAQGLDVEVVNAAIAGNTAADGYARVDRDVPAGTDAAIVALGANDRLGRHDAQLTGGYLDGIVQRLQGRGVRVLLAGFRLPADGGADPYGYERMYRGIAQRHRLAYYPDIYAGLKSDPRLTLFDNTHPSPEGVRRIVAGLLPSVTRFLSGARAGRGRADAAGGPPVSEGRRRTGSPGR